MLDRHPLRTRADQLLLGFQVQMLARMEAMDELRDPDDPDALMMVVDGEAVGVAPAADAE